MNYFSLPLALFATIVFCLVVVTARLLSKTKSFAASVNAKTVVITIVLTFASYSAYYVFSVFSRINSGGTDKFSTHPFGLDTYVINRKAELHQALPLQPYVGEKVAGLHLNPGDTVVVVASYQKGTVASGISYGKILRQGKPYWFADNNAATLFAHTYANQPLTFTMSGPQHAAHWKRAQLYMEKYRVHHGNDITKTTRNDTVLHTRCDYAYGADWLSISRRHTPAGWEFKVDGGTGKSRENCVIDRVKDRFGNRPANPQACAYFIANGSFFEDPLQK